jgi:deoxyribodipyrimidine photo-lyase
MKKYNLALHVFRRDLRIQDNTALLYALKNAQKVIVCFIFDPRELQKNGHRSQKPVEFMIDSLKDLEGEVLKKGGRMYFFAGVAEKVIDQLLENMPIDLVTINRDYTPFALKRDRMIENVCLKKTVAFRCFADALLNEPEAIHKSDGLPYVIFTPFFRRARSIPIKNPVENHFSHYYVKPITLDLGSTAFERVGGEINENYQFSGGRTEGKALLMRIEDLYDYTKKRDYPYLDHTSHLSAHHAFGTVSIRETYHAVTKALSQDHALITQLYWRDFFIHIGFHFPHVFSGSFHKKYDKLAWHFDQEVFQKWCDGETGFPIIDAGMRELNATGSMHNRVRMIVASFLVKDLFINWQWGEKYFAQKLVDHDPAVNNGNWQWAASTGCDAQPYFRIFNPWRQQRKFDPDCLYIKKWISELSALSADEIHALEKDQSLLKKGQYFRPIVDHSKASLYAKAQYKKRSL